VSAFNLQELSGCYLVHLVSSSPVCVCVCACVCADDSRPVRRTDIPWHLRQMLDILLYEDKQQVTHIDVTHS